MEPLHEPVTPGTFAIRSLILPAAASALVALGVGMGFSCHAGPGAWSLLAAPAFAAIGAVGGPEQAIRSRLAIGLISTALNAIVIVGVGLGFSWLSCGA